MPALTGFQLVRRVKDLRPEMKVVMMTMFEVNKQEFEAVFPSATIDGVIRKPSTPSHLVEKNTRIFGHDGTRDYKMHRWALGVIEYLV
jgi:DNA-binding NarL/FixJ family response regulator